MFEAWVTPARPWQTEVVAGDVVACLFVRACRCAQRANVEQVHVTHVCLETVRALARVTDGPQAFVDLIQDGFDLRLAPSLTSKLGLKHLVVLGHLITEAQFVGQSLHDHVVRQ